MTFAEVTPARASSLKTGAMGKTGQAFNRLDALLVTLVTVLKQQKKYCQQLKVFRLQE